MKKKIGDIVGEKVVKKINSYKLAKEKIIKYKKFINNLSVESLELSKLYEILELLQCNEILEEWIEHYLIEDGDLNKSESKIKEETIKYYEDNFSNIYVLESFDNFPTLLLNHKNTKEHEDKIVKILKEFNIKICPVFINVEYHAKLFEPTWCTFDIHEHDFEKKYDNKESCKTCNHKKNEIYDFKVNKKVDYISYDNKFDSKIDISNNFDADYESSYEKYINKNVIDTDWSYDDIEYDGIVRKTVDKNAFIFIRNLKL